MKVSSQWNPFERYDDVNKIKNPYSKQRKLEKSYIFPFLFVPLLREGFTYIIL